MSVELPQFDSEGTGPEMIRELADLLPPGPLRARAAYLHVPFCFHKCHYCDFYSIVDTADRQEAFVSRLIGDLERWAPRLEGRLEAVFMGGGTPTLLRPPLLARLLEAVRDILPLESDVEWTVEANPETVDEPIASVLAASGVTRVSIGCQSFNPRLLDALERHHDPSSVRTALERLRSAGLRAFNLDLIHGIPGSTLEDWAADLEAALALGPEHLSCYGLQYEPNTPMTRKLELGRLERIDDDLEAEMYEHTCERLAAAGYEHYEISNWARPGAACRHNLVYWRSGNWLAFGPSASGHLDGLRWKNVPRLGTWLEAGDGSPVVEVERPEDSVRVGECLMLELRLREGLDGARLQALLDRSDPGDRRRRALDRGLADGLLEPHRGGVRLTERGLLLADGLLSELV